jgi:hypothetical protein
MAKLSAIEEWFYALLPLLEGDDDPRLRFTGRSRTTISDKDIWNTTSTSFYTPDRALDRAMGVKMVADELLAATGAVLGGTAALFASPGAFGLGVQSGEQVGRNLGNFMWNTTVFLMDDRPLSVMFNKGQEPGPKGYRAPY